MNYAMLIARRRTAPKFAGATITFTQQPTNQSAVDGAATFSAAAVVSDESLPTYQWQKQESGSVVWSNVSGATSSSLSFSGLTVAADNGDKYRVVASSPSAASVTSAAATLSVAAPVITITQQPTNQTAVSGEATFSVAATSSPTATLAYQWQRSIFTSETEAAWVANPEMFGDQLSRMTYGSGLFVVVSQSGGASFSSPDGISWTYSVIPKDDFGGVLDVIFAGGLFVAVGGVDAATSSTGLSWTRRSLPRSASRVAYGNGVFLAMQNGSNAFSRSTTGLTWTQDSTGGGTFRGPIAFGNGLFVATSGTSSVLTNSGEPGEEWSSRSLPVSGQWGEIAFGGGMFVIVDRGPFVGGSYQGSDTFVTSTDGITWTARTVPLSRDWRNITYGAGAFVAVSGGTSPTTITSRDGITWTQRALPFGQGIGGTPGIASGGGRFVVSDGDSRVAIASQSTGEFASVTGASSSSLDLSGLSSSDSGDQYRVIVSAANAASVTSSSATLTVN